MGLISSLVTPPEIDRVGVEANDYENAALIIMVSPLLMMLSASLSERFTEGLVLSMVNRILSFPV